MVFLIPVVALVAGGALWVRYIRRRRAAGMTRLADAIPIHSKWWRDATKREGEILYLAIGDSAAQGIGASRPDRSYVGLIAAHVRKTTGRSVRVINLSRSGARLREAIAEQLPRLPKFTPDLVTVSIGANDIADFDEQRFARELEEVYSAVPSHAIVADLPSFYFGAAERRVRTANLIVRRTADKLGLTVAPLHRATGRQTGARYALNQVAADFFHPNDRGYAVWASAFYPDVDARLASRDGGSA